MCLNSLNACKVTIFQTIIQAFLVIFFTYRAKRKEEAPPSLPEGGGVPMPAKDSKILYLSDNQ